MRGKDKPCDFCPTIGPLWRSSPATCPSCARKQAAQQAIEVSKGNHSHNGLKQTEGVAKPFRVYQTKSHKRAKSLTVDKINKKAAINQFFDEQALQVPERCENCNLRLNAYATWQKRFVTAHILPKALFPSVAANPDNRMFLGVGLFSECSCHPAYDNSDAEARKKMRCYDLALSRAEKFYDKLTGHEQNRFDKYFGLVKAV